MARTHSFVPRVPELGHTEVEADAERERAGEDGGDVDTCAREGEPRPCRTGGCTRKDSLLRLTIVL